MPVGPSDENVLTPVLVLLETGDWVVENERVLVALLVYRAVEVYDSGNVRSVVYFTVTNLLELGNRILSRVLVRCISMPIYVEGKLLVV